MESRMKHLFRFLFPSWKGDSLFLCLLCIALFALVSLVHQPHWSCLSDSSLISTLLPFLEISWQEWLVFFCCGVIFASTLSRLAAMVQLQNRTRFRIFYLILLCVFSAYFFTQELAVTAYAIAAFFCSQVACHLLVKAYSGHHARYIPLALFFLTLIACIHPFFLLCFVAIFKFRVMWVCVVNGQIRLYRFACLWLMVALAVVIRNLVDSIGINIFRMTEVLQNPSDMISTLSLLPSMGVLMLIVLLLVCVVSLKASSLIESNANRAYWFAMLIFLVSLLFILPCLQPKEGWFAPCLFVWFYLYSAVVALPLVMPSRSKSKCTRS